QSDPPLLWPGLLTGPRLATEGLPCCAIGRPGVGHSGRVGRPGYNTGAVRMRRWRELFDELHVPPGRGRQIPTGVVAVAAPLEAARGELVPLLAGDFAGLAADADGGVRVEAGRRLRLRRRAAAERPDEAVHQRRQPAAGLVDARRQRCQLLFSN